MAEQGSSHIWFFKGDRQFHVAKTDIMYLEADGYTTKVYYFDRQKRTMETFSKAYNLGRIEEEELNDRFFRIHRKYCINLDFYSNLYNGMVELTEPSVQPLPVSRTKRPKLRLRLLS